MTSIQQILGEFIDAWNAGRRPDVDEYLARALDDARGALADDMRTKLLFDLAYVAALERFTTFIITELWIIVQTPAIMLRGLGR